MRHLLKRGVGGDDDLIEMDGVPVRYHATAGFVPEFRDCCVFEDRRAHGSGFVGQSLQILNGVKLELVGKPIPTGTGWRSCSSNATASP